MTTTYPDHLLTVMAWPAGGVQGFCKCGWWTHDHDSDVISERYRAHVEEHHRQEVLFS